MSGYFHNRTILLYDLKLSISIYFFPVQHSYLQPVNYKINININRIKFHSGKSNRCFLEEPGKYLSLINKNVRKTPVLLKTCFVSSSHSLDQDTLVRNQFQNWGHRTCIKYPLVPLPGYNRAASAVPNMRNPMEVYTYVLSSCYP